MSARGGRVTLVGAGPGHPGLLTLRARELLAEADVILADRLVHPGVLRFAGEGARVIDVGKRRGAAGPGRPPSRKAQRWIESLMVRLARGGKHVVRLKGGSPFLFGRGGEEAEVLMRARVPWEVVPGISSALGVPAAAGIPLTRRGVASSMAIVSGHLAGRGVEEAVTWELLAHAVHTIVVLMGARNAARIAARLLKAGLPPATPVTAIERGTWPGERIVETTLADAGRALGHLRPPAVVVVGKVAGLRRRLDRGRARPPLDGVRVAVTRAAGKGSSLAEKLARAGAEVSEWPAIRFAPVRRTPRLRRAVATAGGNDWVLFTSAEGVERFFDELSACGLDARALASCSVGAIGPGTAGALRRRGVLADLVPGRSDAEGLLKAMGRVGGRRVLLPRAAAGRDVLPRGLRSRGAVVTDLPLYRTLPAVPGLRRLSRAIERGEVDAVTFTSSSQAEFAMAAMSAPGRRRLRAGRVTAASIGPITSRTLRRFGIRPAVEARPPSMDAMVGGLVRYYERGRAARRRRSTRTRP